MVATLANTATTKKVNGNNSSLSKMNVSAGSTNSTSPALQALKNNATSGRTTTSGNGNVTLASNTGATSNKQSSSTSDTDPTTATYTPVDTSATNQSYADALAAQEEANAQAENAAQLYAQQATNSASSSAAKAGLQGGSASYLSGARAASLAGEQNLLNTYSTNASNISDIYEDQAGTNASTASQNATGINTVNQNNVDYAREQTAAQQETTTAAKEAEISTLQGQYDAHKGWTDTSAAAGDWANAQQEYSDAVANNDSAAADAAIDKMDKIAAGTDYTSDGHSRTDPALKDRINGVEKTEKHDDGSYTYYDGKGNKVADMDANGNLIYYYGD